MILKSPFRYPGGKSKAIKFIKPYWEQIQHTEYREPFVGGGSVFISKSKVKINWINDIDEDLIAFYKTISDDEQREILISELLSLDISKEVYEELYYSSPKDDYEKAKRFYVINRCSFSGILRWNSYIGKVRYNILSAQNNIRNVGQKLSDYIITAYDFEKVLKQKSSEENVFIYLDPPYAESRQIVAYNYPFGHEDHIRLSKILKKTEHSFLLTYDDCQFIRELYD